MDNTTADQLQKGMEELSAMFSTRMGDFERSLQQPGSSAPSSTVKSLAAEFSSFKTFMWKSLGILKSQVDLLALGLDRMETQSRRKVLLFHGIKEEKEEDACLMMEMEGGHRNFVTKRLIVEEAAEVLEQHIVTTSLTKNCKHLILIGDHQQLRPSAAHMKLARHYNIEISLFERMINNGIHSRRLGVQHRMRPEIAALISPHIYEHLENHPSVEHFPSVRGITDNLFFFTHDQIEERVDDSSSRSNKFEADMTLRLANYLMQQGYEPEDITILAAYSGQMFYLRKKARAALHRDVRAICSESCHLLGLDVSKPAMEIIAELVYKKLSVYGSDLEAFAKHAKRTTVNSEDVKLLARRNPSLKTHLNKIVPTNPVTTKEKRRKTLPASKQQETLAKTKDDANFKEVTNVTKVSSNVTKTKNVEKERNDVFPDEDFVENMVVDDTIDLTFD